MKFKVKKEEIPTGPSPTEVLEARQAELLALLDTLDKNSFSSRGHVENALAEVNKQLA